MVARRSRYGQGGRVLVWELYFFSCGGDPVAQLLWIMSNKEYRINKGVNRPIEFRGLKAQYIWWLAGGIVGLMALFAGLYLAGVNPFLCMGLIGVMGMILFRQVYKMSRLYG